MCVHMCVFITEECVYNVSLIHTCIHVKWSFLCTYVYPVQLAMCPCYVCRCCNSDNLSFVCSLLWSSGGNTIPPKHSRRWILEAFMQHSPMNVICLCKLCKTKARFIYTAHSILSINLVNKSNYYPSSSCKQHLSQSFIGE